jgi:hypothetical protein
VGLDEEAPLGGLDIAAGHAGDQLGEFPPELSGGVLQIHDEHGAWLVGALQQVRGERVETQGAAEGQLAQKGGLPIALAAGNDQSVAPLQQARDQPVVFRLVGVEQVGHRGQLLDPRSVTLLAVSIGATWRWLQAWD